MAQGNKQKRHEKEREGEAVQHCLWRMQVAVGARWRWRWGVAKWSNDARGSKERTRLGIRGVSREVRFVQRGAHSRAGGRGVELQVASIEWRERREAEARATQRSQRGELRVRAAGVRLELGV